MEKKSLFPVIRAPEFVTPKKEEKLAYQPGIGFDVVTGDFIRDGSNRLIYSKGKEAFQLWCYKMSVTERYSCMAYPGRYGVEMELSLKEPDEKAVESSIQRTISEALKENPRTEYVRGFSFTRKGDRLECSFIVKGVNMEEFTLTVDVDDWKKKGEEASWQRNL